MNCKINNQYKTKIYLFSSKIINSSSRINRSSSSHSAECLKWMELCTVWGVSAVAMEWQMAIIIISRIMISNSWSKILSCLLNLLSTVSNSNTGITKTSEAVNNNTTTETGQEWISPGRTLKGTYQITTRMDKTSSKTKTTKISMEAYKMLWIILNSRKWWINQCI